VRLPRPTGRHCRGCALRDFDAPAPVTVHRWLRRAVERHIVLCEGTDRKRDPLRHGLAKTEAQWRERNPFYDRYQQQERDLGIPFMLLNAVRNESTLAAKNRPTFHGSRNGTKKRNQ
jgi:hypothetical protein